MVYAEPNWSCPSNFPHKLPQLVFDFTVDSSSVVPNTNGPTYILSNGEYSGSGLHGDFFNGWNSTVLQAIIDNCGPQTTISPSTCPVLQTLQGSGADAAANACDFEGEIPSEDDGVSGNAIAALPGCNSPFDASNGPPSANCTDSCQPSWVTPDSLVGNFKLPIASTSCTGQSGAEASDPPGLASVPALDNTASPQSLGQELAQESSGNFFLQTKYGLRVLPPLLFLVMTLFGDTIG